MPIVYRTGKEPKYTTPEGVENAGSALEQFKGTPYQDLAQSYYNSLSAQWKQGNALEFLTHRAEDFNSQLLEGYYSDINNLLSSMHQPDFNSDSMKAESQTMTHLGINPSLNGVSSFGSGAGDAPQSEAQDLPKKGNDLQVVSTTITQALNIAFELYGKSQQFNSMRLDNDIKQMNLTNSIESWAANWWSDNPSFGEDPQVVDDIDSFIKSLGTDLSPKTRKQLPGMFSRAKAKISTSIKHNKYVSDEYDSRKEKVGRQSLFGDAVNPIDKGIEAIIGPIYKLSYSSQKALLQSDIARNNSDARYYQDFDPTKKAIADNAQNEFLSSDFKLKTNVQSTMKEITDNLVKLSRTGNWAERTFADSLLVGLWMASAMNFNVSAGGLVSKIIK